MGDSLSQEALRKEVQQIQEYLREQGQYRSANMLDLIQYGDDKKEQFATELAYLINRCSMENGSDTPDFILAHYLKKCLEAYEYAARTRDKWFGFEPWNRNVMARVAGEGEAHG